MSEDSDDADRADMLRLKNGDDLALNALMSRWQLPLVSFIQRYVGNEAEALDLAQETFVRIFESRHRYRPSAKFSTWMFTIASNLCRNFFRWQKRHPVVSLDAPASSRRYSVDSVESPGVSPADSVERDELAAAVREQIHALPHDLKTAILLFEYEDLSHQEIAVVLSCSAKAVETRLYRARKILSKKLAHWRGGGIQTGQS
jgi:RNA polymerase sigma factor (sigma-70 family)